MNDQPTYDFVVIGSGFGGSVSAMRLTEKGYKVLVLERGKRFRDEDFAKRDWNIWRHEWIPVLRCFGIWQNTILNDVMIMHGSGVGGGSLVYGNVLMEPDDKFFASPAWRHLADWKTVLRPHYETAKRMLGVTPNPRLWPADHTLKTIADDLEKGHTYHPTEVGVFFNEKNPGELVSDPYFGGEGPDRRGCTHCGACMVGCRENAKNTLVKNYLYFAEKWGTKVQPESTVKDIRPLPSNQSDGARYEVCYYRTTAFLMKPLKRVRARSVVVSAGAVNTNRLLLRCRDVTRSLPVLSKKLGHNVRTNSDSFTGLTARDWKTDYSKGIAIGSIFQVDDITQMEALRFPSGSDATLTLLGAPLIQAGSSILVRILKTIWQAICHPVDFIGVKILPGIARRSTVLLTMRAEDKVMRVKLERGFFTLFRRDLVCKRDEERPIDTAVEVAHRITRMFAKKVDSIPQGMVHESSLNMSTTGHFMGGVPFSEGSDDGVVGMNCEVHNYPGLYVVDGSIIPANPGINPSLTITALAEYAMDQIPPKNNAYVYKLFGK